MAVVDAGIQEADEWRILSKGTEPCDKIIAPSMLLGRRLARKEIRRHLGLAHLGNDAKHIGAAR